MRKFACFFVRQKLERKSKFMDLELLKSKTLSDLREIAKLAGVKSVTTYKKSELLEILFGLEQEQQAENPEQEPKKIP